MVRERVQTGMKIELCDIGDLIPYARNARKIPQAAIDKVAASLKEFGWRQPIVVDKEFVLIVGHVRLLAAKQLGMAKVPVHVAVNLTAAQVKAYRLMDNRSHNEAGWDYELLAVELGELGELNVNLELMTGFDPSELEPILAAEWKPAEPEGDLENDHRGAGKLPSISFTVEQKQVVDSAIKKIREGEGDVAITEGRAVELICADYLSGE